ncbi:hypothetical protein REPUB_Repub09cG0088600 [Reevesia pubescens]
MVMYQQLENQDLPGGIGGGLREKQGTVKIMFSKTVGIADSNLAEFLAIREAFYLFCGI